MKTYILNFKDKETAASMHNYLTSMLDLPEYYGHNLDALYDCLTSLSAASNISIANIDENNELHRRTLRVFKDAASANPKIHLQPPQGNWTY